MEERHLFQWMYFNRKVDTLLNIIQYGDFEKELKDMLMNSYIHYNDLISKVFDKQGMLTDLTAHRELMDLNIKQLVEDHKKQLAVKKDEYIDRARRIAFEEESENIKIKR